ncbi:MAG: disulfide bond formation protein B [Agarilytica sp.]
MNIVLPSPRLIFFLLAATCAAMIGVGLIMQYVFDMEPCPLCITQRVFIIAVGVISLIAGFHNPPTLWRRIYGGAGVVAAMIGGGVSARHVWIQNLPEDQVPTCGPGLSYMFETLPMFDALSLLFAGDGNCADEVFNFIGLSIPGWTLVAFIGLACICVWQIFRPNSNT